MNLVEDPGLIHEFGVFLRERQGIHQGMPLLSSVLPVGGQMRERDDCGETALELNVSRCGKARDGSQTLKSRNS
jgi:hypothetical protein